MKVLREAAVNSINQAKNDFNDAQTFEEKVEVFSEFAKENRVLKDDVIDKITSYTPSFVVKWINAMRWDEIGRDGNEFIFLLNHITPASIALSSEDHFTKIYNVYAANYFENEYLAGNTDSDKIYQCLILGFNSNSVYDWDQNEITNTFKLYNNLRNRNISDEQMRNIFLEDPDVAEPEQSNLNSYADIMSKAQGAGAKKEEPKSNDDMSDEEANNLLKKLLQRPQFEGKNAIQILNDLGMIR